MLDTHQLNVFLVAADTLNFTQAARLLHMSQPSVSQHIQSLEQSFGQTLFIRSGRQMELTAAGQALVPLARDMVEKSHMIEETMKSLEGEVHGHLRVGCSTTPGKYILPQLLATFLSDYPLVRAACHVTSQGRAMEMLCDGEVHVAMVSEPHMACRTAEVRRFMVDPMVLIAPLDHPWAARGVIEPEELYEGAFIMREEGSGTLMTVSDGLADVGVSAEDLETLLVLGSSEAIALGVKEGIGVGFVSQIVVTRLVEHEVASIQVRGLDLKREIYIGSQNRKPATTAQKAFWRFIERDLAREQAIQQVEAEALSAA